ncbi:DUF935 domain-containing protein [Polycladidibacter hongkongensis]|uniref:DUF935 domain-containing protein n=1 Tax=Polycladidibacter hongkongensis TaxID=1647556 RepID=UPI00082DA0D5|nr:DUF935 domain-containing protein [Pseudovibrio hongkongensis]
MDLKKTLKRFAKPKKLAQRQATATSQGVRSVVGEPVANSITPQKLAGILKAAVDDDPAEFFELAQEMEERDGHYASVLSTRKLALIGLEDDLGAEDSDKKAQEIAEAVRTDVLENPLFDGLKMDLLDALGKGVALVEITWDTSGPRWKPAAFDWVDPRWLQFDKQTRREIRLKQDENAEGIALQEFKYVTHLPKIKSGLPVRGGLARLAVWSWMLKSYTLKDWAAFCEIFGQPLRLGKYSAKASDKDKRALLQAVRSIARDAAAIIPQTMDMELIQSKSTGGAVFKELAEYLDKQISKAVLGQTMTTDDGSSQSQATVHDDVRSDIKAADAAQLARSINTHLIQPYVMLNFGRQERYPVYKLVIEEPEDLKTEVEILDTLLSNGLDVSRSQIRDKFGWRAPEDEEDVFLVKQKEEPQKSADKPPMSTALNRQNLQTDAQEHMHDHPDHLDTIIQDGLSDWQKQGDPLLDPVFKVLEQAHDYAGFLKALESLMQQQDMGPLTDALTQATIKARISGAADE